MLSFLHANEDFSEYVYTTKILRDDFAKDSNYIRRFIEFAKLTGISLDPLFLGLKDSKSYTENKNGYNEIQQAEGRTLLKKLVSQQFTHAKPSDHPTYFAIAGAPGAGKTHTLQQQFAIDVL